MTNTYPITLEDEEAALDFVSAALAAKIADSEEETFPAALVDRLIAGEPTVRVYREYRNMTQADLAAASGISRATIAQIERGAQTGTVTALKAIASALNLTIDDLV
ncbi:MAG: helix-turn-helix transcriptional regulator [Pseudomonadota bacterium]